MNYLKLYENYYKKEIPNILYHSSNSKFINFELMSGFRTSLMNVEKVKSLSIFLTDSLESSRSYGDKYTYVCEINTKRNLDWSEFIDIRSRSWIIKNIGNIIPFNNDEYWMLMDNKKVIHYLKNRAIDCVVLTEYDERSKDVFSTFAILDPKKIKIIDIVNHNI
jgi:hypothetical protein